MASTSLFDKQQRVAIVTALNTVLDQGRPADKALQQIMRAHPRWSDEQRAAVADAVYDIVRRWRLLVTAAGVEPHTDEQALEYILTVWMIYRHNAMPSSQRIDVPALRARFAKYRKIPAIWESYPEWLYKLGEKECGTQWPFLAEALNRPPQTILRTNTLKQSPKELRELLKNENVDVEPVNDVPGAFLLQSTINIFRTKAFSEGCFEVQDSGSQEVGLFCQVKPGMRVIDACAGAGGKSLHLAALMQNKGRLMALDTKEGKLEELRRRARRAGVHIIEAKPIDSVKVLKRLKGSADRVLIDAPCSGSGVLRRNPDLRWRLHPDDLDRLHETQKRLLDQYSEMVAPGGALVYAVCSVFPSEGEEIVAAFLAQHGDKWILREEKRCDPAQTVCDGFYMAMIERKNDSAAEKAAIAS